MLERACALLVLACVVQCVIMAMPQAGSEGLGLPIGFRFMPNDEELTVYLRKKALSLPLPSDIIPVADLAGIHPADLPGGEAHEEKFFFSRPVPRCGRRACRQAAPGAAGVWKASGTEELVVVSPRHVPVALKQTLVFFSADGTRTRWVMHEYRLHPAMLATAARIGKAVDNWVVCRVFKKGTRRDGNLQDVFGPSSPASSCVTE
ncbi:NAC domain-containing protein 83-like [Brachypodium distachyon]|uniref:NAC domain-containing protein n=1 Tax=Brachypodium distachyon TaxID=15368 RepID=A0A0Q3EJB1_BRADI|nr:NAC domain-containing protein 83-like [Brachypodium distachyon]KQJ87798.1 hypothetical protein BRADI_4g13586v3 [Brachypodium distachyon]|eukprot:XP_024310836.1 NAC domain-containing protein 83-like [Brachypodium distachyon]